MTTLSASRTRAYTNTNINGLLVPATTTIYAGAAVGVNEATGSPRPLQAGDKFIGFAQSSVNHIRGQEREAPLTVVDSGQVALQISGAVATDIGKDVFATDDDTFTFSSSGGSLVGVAKQLLSAGRMLAEILPPSALNGVRLAPGGTALVSGDGKTLSPAFPLATPAQVAPDDYAIQPATLRALVLPNVYPAQSLHVVHPSLLVFPSGFQGYRYWLAFTPYPSAQSDYENPCIVASNDLITWSQPTTNPLAEKPTGGYNADTHLFMSADGATMHLSYRERVIGGQNRVMVRSTTDGVNWTTARSIAAGTQGSQDYACQSIWWNGTGWTMISHNLDAGSPWPVQRSVSTSADLFGGFGAPSTVTIAPPAGRAWWHTFFLRLSSGQVIGICQDNAISAGSAGNLYWAVSGDDGATFAVSAPISFSGASRYRSCFAFEGTLMHMMTGNGLTDIDYVQAQPGRLDLLADVRGQVAGQLAAAAIPGNVLWADSCIRGDSAVSAGTASSGGSYIVSSGTWGISSNQIYPVATGRLLASVGTPNHRVMAQFSSITSAVQQWIIGRAVDASNYWRCGIQTPTASGVQTVGLQVVIGGVATDYPGVARCQIGDTIGLDFSGSRVRVLVNGQAVYEMQSAQFAGTGNSIGLQANLGATSRYRNIVCTAN